MQPVLLFVVEDVFQITGRGCVLVPGLSGEPDAPAVRVGDPIRLVKPDGSILDTTVCGLEMIGRRQRPAVITVPVLLSREVNKDQVPIETLVLALASSAQETSGADGHRRKGMPAPRDAREPQAQSPGATVLSRVEFTEQVRGSLAAEAAGSLLYIDVDHLARVNYIWGFEKGDDALRRLVTVLQAAAPHDLVGRFGGDEFVVYSQQGSDAQKLAEEIRSQIEHDDKLAEIRAATPGLATATANEHVSRSPFLTVSIGVAHAAPGSSFEEVLQAAHEAHNAAKALGRNRIVVSQLRDARTT